MYTVSGTNQDHGEVMSEITTLQNEMPPSKYQTNIRIAPWANIFKIHILHHTRGIILQEINRREPPSDAQIILLAIQN